MIQEELSNLDEVQLGRDTRSISSTGRVRYNVKKFFENIEKAHVTMEQVIKYLEAAKDATEKDRVDFPSAFMKQAERLHKALSLKEIEKKDPYAK